MLEKRNPKFSASDPHDHSCVSHHFKTLASSLEKKDSDGTVVTIPLENSPCKINCHSHGGRYSGLVVSLLNGNVPSALKKVDLHVWIEGRHFRCGYSRTYFLFTFHGTKNYFVSEIQQTINSEDNFISSSFE